MCHIEKLGVSQGEAKVEDGCRIVLFVGQSEVEPISEGTLYKQQSG